jgi:preprotein translocase subunit SecD
MRGLGRVFLVAGLCASIWGADTNQRAKLFEIREVLEKPGAETVEMEVAHKEQKEKLNVSKKTLLDGTAVRSVSVGEDLSGSPHIEVAFSNEGAKRFSDITAERVGKRLAILIEGKVQSAPVIAMRIPGGRAQIAGNFTKEEAGEMVRRINRALEVKNDILNPPKPAETPK